jgi:hypothetical protein
VDVWQRRAAWSSDAVCVPPRCASTIADELSPVSYEPLCPVPQRPRRPLWALLVVVGLALATRTPASSASHSVPSLDGVLVAPPGKAADADTLQRLLSARGVRGRLLYPPDVAVAHVSAAGARRLRAAGFTVLRADASPPQGASSRLLRALRLVKALRDEAQAPPGPLPAVDAAALGGGSDLKQPVPPATSATGAASPAPLTGASPLLGQLPTASELAAFAGGSVTVSVIFPQSTGPASTENWADGDPTNPGDRRAFLLTRVDLALAWWATYKPSPQFTSRLTFVIPPAGILGAPQTVSVSSEPIRQSSANDILWRNEIMTSLHYSEGSPLPETAYGDAVRRANGTEWALTVYVVDSLHDADGEFADKLFAYTYDLFGPYMVLTYDNDGYGPLYFDSVMAHEMGHVFGALDEYYMPPSSGYPSGGSLSSGYLWVRNTNAEGTGTTDYSCIMRGGDQSIAAYRGQDICPSTRGQVGWLDKDGDGIPNVIDTFPSFSLPQPTVAGDGALTVAGTVQENPWPRGGKPPLQAFDHNISIYVPHDVQYRLDDGAWLPATPADGAFDQPVEPFSLSAGPLAPGHHLLELQATTGNTASQVLYVWAGTTPVELQLAVDRSVVTYGSSAVFTVTSAATDATGTYPVSLLPQVGLGRVGGTPATPLVTRADGTVRRAVKPTYNGRYVATFAGVGQFTGPASSPAVSVRVRVAVSQRRGASPIRLGDTMRVWGVVRPAKLHAPVVLQETRDSGATWRIVAHIRTDASSRYSLVYRATHRGIVRLRVRYGGDARNLAGGVLVSAFKVD